MGQVFFSYAREDLAAAEKIVSDLLAHGIDVWFDQISLKGGDPWKIKIQQAIRESEYFVALLSNQSVSKRGHVNVEIREALDVRKTMPEDQRYIIPLYLEACNPSYEELHHYHRIELFPSYETGLEKLLLALRDAVSSETGYRSVKTQNTQPRTPDKSRVDKKKVRDERVDDRGSEKTQRNNQTPRSPRVSPVEGAGTDLPRAMEELRAVYTELRKIEEYLIKERGQITSESIRYIEELLANISLRLMKLRRANPMESFSSSIGLISENLEVAQNHLLTALESKQPTNTFFTNLTRSRSHITRSIEVFASFGIFDFPISPRSSPFNQEEMRAAYNELRDIEEYLIRERGQIASGSISHIEERLGNISWRLMELRRSNPMEPFFNSITTILEELEVAQNHLLTALKSNRPTNTFFTNLTRSRSHITRAVEAFHFDIS